MPSPILGIDLGTTNSVVAVADAQSVRVLATEESQRLIPSVVAFPPDSPMLVGRAARERRLIDARNTVYSVKRLIGRPFRSPEVRTAQDRFAFELIEGPTGGVAVRVRSGTYQVPEISAFILREARRVAELALGQACSKAVVTVPANFNELQRSATKAAGSIAGLEVLRILNEPTAAALAYGYRTAGTERIAVYDFGGGTFDFTILEAESDSLQVVATAGDTFLGGDDFDVLLADELSERFLRRHRWNPRDDLQAFERLRAAAEWAKCQLSTEKKINVRVRELAYGPGGQSLDLDEEIRRGDLEAKIRPLVGRSFDVVQDCLRLASLKPTDVDTVVLVGGSTRVPLVQMLVKEYFRKEPKTGVDPDLVVAQGAAIQGRSLLGASDQTAIGKIKLKRVTRSDADSARKKSGRKGSKRTVDQPAFGPDRPAPAPQQAGKRPAVRLGSIIEVGPDEAEVRPTGEMDISGATLRDQPSPLKHVPSLDMSQTLDPTSSSIVIDPVYAELSASLAGKNVDELFATSSDVLTHPDALPSPLDDEPTRVTKPIASPFAPVVSAAPPAAAPPAARPQPQRRESTRPFATRPIEPPIKDTLESDPLTVAARGPLPAPHAPPPAPPPAAPPPAAPSARRASGRARAPAPPPPPPPPTPQPLTPQAAPPASAFAVVAPTPQQEVPLFPPTSTVNLSEQADPFADIDALQLPQRAAPLLMDVTPHGLGLETVGGYCRQIIRRGAPIPTESSRTFTTARDLQESVIIRVCQGEGEQFADNQQLGEIVLDGLPLAPRGTVQIDVAFQLSADGTLVVRAVDIHTQREQRIRVQLLGGMSPEEIAALRRRQESMQR